MTALKFGRNHQEQAAERRTLSTTLVSVAGFRAEASTGGSKELLVEAKLTAIAGHLAHPRFRDDRAFLFGASAQFCCAPSAQRAEADLHAGTTDFPARARECCVVHSLHNPAARPHQHPAKLGALVAC